MIQLAPAFRKLLKSLNSNGVEYLIIGGYAVVYHGYVRTTGDLDIWIRCTLENATRTVEAIRAIGYNPAGLKPELLLRPGGVLRIGSEPFAFDIVNQIDGVTFDDCYTRRMHAEIDGITLNVISLADLKANKAATGRNKDRADLDYLP
jgi:predicted nucleotidyltransferase